MPLSCVCWCYVLSTELTCLVFFPQHSSHVIKSLEEEVGACCFYFNFFSFYFCVFLLICSDLHLSHCDLQISIWLHCLVNTTFQGYCYQVDLHQRKEEQKLIRTAQYHFIVHEFNSNCPWSLIFEAHRYKRCSLIAVSLLLSAYIQGVS